MCYNVEGGFREETGSLPVYRRRCVLYEAYHLLLHVNRLGLESKSHFIDQRLHTSAVSRAAQRLSLRWWGKKNKKQQIIVKK